MEHASNKTSRYRYKRYQPYCYGNMLPTRCTTIEHIIQGHTVVNHTTTGTYLPKVSLALSKAYITHISIHITRVYNHTRLLHGRMNVVKDVLMGKRWSKSIHHVCFKTWGGLEVKLRIVSGYVTGCSITRYHNWPRNLGYGKGMIHKVY